MDNVVVFKTPERAIREHALLKYGELPPPYEEPDKNIPRKRRKERARELTRQRECQLAREAEHRNHEQRLEAARREIEFRPNAIIRKKKGKRK